MSSASVGSLHVSRQRRKALFCRGRLCQAIESSVPEWWMGKKCMLLYGSIEYRASLMLLLVYYSRRCFLSTYNTASFVTHPRVPTAPDLVNKKLRNPIRGS